MVEKEKLVYYFQRKNDLFGDNVLSICYKASENEIKINHLTDKNVLIFIKCKDHDNAEMLNNKFDIKEYIKTTFKNKNIFLRVQSECILGMYGDSHCDCEKQRQESIKLIAEKGGIFIHLPQEALGYGIEYKFKELELQVNGKNQSGEFVGIKDKEEAQKYIMNTTNFTDIRKYNIIYNIIKDLGLINNKLILITDSEKKINELECLGLRIEKYAEYMETQITSENISEYLSKILENKYSYSEEIIDEILNILKEEHRNQRALDILIKIVKKINCDKEYNLKKNIKEKILDTYNDIICGKEKKYIYYDSGITKIQNKYSCRVNTKIFGAIKHVFGKNIFDRIVAEQLYFFRKKSNGIIVKVRNSEILKVSNDSTCFLNGQIYSQQSTFSEDNERIIENEITTSRLKTYFENESYEYLKKLETITFISENQIDGLDIYIKRLPRVENRIMDVYGKKEDIRKFLYSIDRENALINLISDFKAEDEDDIKYNLIFADYDSAKSEELRMFDILNKG